MTTSMVAPGYAAEMARYNRWQNESLYGAADTLTDAARRQERGAFFGSIHGTLAHLLWGDRMWLSRFTDVPRPETSQAASPGFVEGWGDLRALRAETDDALTAWAGAMTDGTLSGDYAWYSGSAGREVSVPMQRIVMHVFNHQTHHRGQVHAMLTAAGARPGPTDLFLMPKE